MPCKRGSARLRPLNARPSVKKLKRNLTVEIYLSKRNVNFYLTLLTICLISFGCKTLPEVRKPEGAIGVIAYDAGIVVQREISNRKPLPDLPLSEADGYIAMPLSTFNSINRMIDDLLEVIGEKNLKVTPAQIQEVQRDVNLLVEDLQAEKMLLVP